MLDFFRLRLLTKLSTHDPVIANCTIDKELYSIENSGQITKFSADAELMVQTLLSDLSPIEAYYHFSRTNLGADKFENVCKSYLDSCI